MSYVFDLPYEMNNIINDYKYNVHKNQFKKVLKEIIFLSNIAKQNNFDIELFMIYLELLYKINKCI